MNRSRRLRTLLQLLALLAAALVVASPLLAADGQDSAGQGDHAGHGDHAEHAEHAEHDGAAADPHAHHRAQLEQPEVRTEDLGGLTIPDVQVTTQDGRTLSFRELVRGKTVVMNFIFTTCTTICPPMGANFGKLQKLLGDEVGKSVHLISVSVDPVTDTPQRLAAWGANFGAGPGWTLVTGGKAEITKLLKDLQVFTPDIREHAATVILGNEPAGTWTRAYGLAPPAKLAEILDGLAPRTAAAGPSAEPSAAERYFTNVELVNQKGETMHLYDDLIKGKIVVIDAMFTSCTGVCPVMASALKAIQERVGDRLGQDVHLISISLDPETDTPPKLAEYAERFGARPGWYFLTGAKENVDFALHKLGQFAEVKETHQAVIIVGNERTGLWKKAFGLAAKPEILAIVESVLADQG